LHVGGGVAVDVDFLLGTKESLRHVTLGLLDLAYDRFAFGLRLLAVGR
jgi:hypothetical protein